MDFIIDYVSRVLTYDWWVVAIELILIGFIVFWAIDFLEGTRGERLFRGVLFILIAGVLVLKLIVEQLQFERLDFLYNGFLLAVLVVAVAAFQPEIRRALIRIGQHSFLSSSTQQLARTVEEIIAATIDLSSSKTGAIIVVEKQVGLGEFIETGVQMDARISSELLRTIFKPGTPLHDMAVIIRNDRIVAASVQLPLAESGSVDGVELGSRHRAALGVSAGSDADVIVVSEETGIVSIAQHGKLIRNITEAQLRRYLTKTIEDLAPITEKLLKRKKYKVQESPEQEK